MRYLRIIGMIAFFAASSACYAEDSASKNDKREFYDNRKIGREGCKFRNDHQGSHAAGTCGISTSAGGLQ